MALPYQFQFGMGKGNQSSADKPASIFPSRGQAQKIVRDEQDIAKSLAKAVDAFKKLEEPIGDVNKLATKFTKLFEGFINDFSTRLKPLSGKLAADLNKIGNEYVRQQVGSLSKLSSNQQAFSNKLSQLSKTEAAMIKAGAWKGPTQPRTIQPSTLLQIPHVIQQHYRPPGSKYLVSQHAIEAEYVRIETERLNIEKRNQFSRQFFGGMHRPLGLPPPGPPPLADIGERRPPGGLGPVPPGWKENIYPYSSLSEEFLKRKYNKMPPWGWGKRGVFDSFGIGRMAEPWLGYGRLRGDVNPELYERMLHPEGQITYPFTPLSARPVPGKASSIENLRLQEYGIGGGGGGIVPPSGGGGRGRGRLPGMAGVIFGGRGGILGGIGNILEGVAAGTLAGGPVGGVIGGTLEAVGTGLDLINDSVKKGKPALDAWEAITTAGRTTGLSTERIGSMFGKGPGDYILSINHALARLGIQTSAQAAGIVGAYGLSSGAQKALYGSAIFSQSKYLGFQGPEEWAGYFGQMRGMGMLGGAGGIPELGKIIQTAIEKAKPFGINAERTFEAINTVIGGAASAGTIISPGHAAAMAAAGFGSGLIGLRTGEMQGAALGAWQQQANRLPNYPLDVTSMLSMLGGKVTPESIKALARKLHVEVPPITGALAKDLRSGRENPLISLMGLTSMGMTGELNAAAKDYALKQAGMPPLARMMYQPEASRPYFAAHTLGFKLGPLGVGGGKDIDVGKVADWFDISKTTNKELQKFIDEMTSKGIEPFNVKDVSDLMYRRQMVADLTNQQLALSNLIGKVADRSGLDTINTSIRDIYNWLSSNLGPHTSTLGMTPISAHRSTAILPVIPGLPGTPMPAHPTTITGLGFSIAHPHVVPAAGGSRPISPMP